MVEELLVLLRRRAESVSGQGGLTTAPRGWQELVDGSR